MIGIVKQTAIIFPLLITLLWASPMQHTQSEAEQWIQNRINEEWAADYDGIGMRGVPQCVDLVEYYCDYLVGYHFIGNANDYKNLILPKGWKYVDTPQSGDIAVWDKSETRKYGHVAIVENIYQELGMFSYIDIDGLTGEFGHKIQFIEGPTTYIRPDWGPEIKTGERTNTEQNVNTATSDIGR